MRFVVFVFVFEFVHHALWINRGRLSNLRGRWYLSLPVSLCCSPHTDRMKLTSFGGSAATDVDMVATVIATTIKNAHIDVFKDSFMVGMFRQGQLVVWVARDRENSVLGWNIL